MKTSSCEQKTSAETTKKRNKGAVFMHSAITAAACAVMLVFSSCMPDVPAGTNNPKDEEESNALQPEISEADADGKFTIAILPDTQQEVIGESAIENELFLNRTEWLAENKEELDLRFVIHTGDIVNWGNEEPEQFEIASEAIAVLDEADIPVGLCLGNHDTAAVGVGGSAADPDNTKTRVRDTESFNEYFSLDRYPDCIPFEDDKIDNAYQFFEAGGKEWLVLTLELWPRGDVIAWANRIVEMHSDKNVIVATHSYLTSSGELMQSNGGYGATSPQYLYDTFISKHENIKLVFCGHNGTSAMREDFGESGEKIVSLLGCYHSSDKNPVQIVEIDVNEGTISSRVFTPIDGGEWTDHAYTVDGLEF